MLIVTSNKVNSKRRLRQSVEAALERYYPNYDVQKHDYLKNALKPNNILLIDDLEQFLSKGLVESNPLDYWTDIVSRDIFNFKPCQEISQSYYEKEILDYYKVNLITEYPPENYFYDTRHFIPAQTNLKKRSEPINFLYPFSPNFSTNDLRVFDNKYQLFNEPGETGIYVPEFLDNLSIELCVDELNNIITYRIKTKNGFSFEFEKRDIFYFLFEILPDELQNLPPPSTHVLMSIFFNFNGINYHEKTKKTFSYN
jgi:hypothetical protein